MPEPASPLRSPNAIARSNAPNLSLKSPWLWIFVALLAGYALVILAAPSAPTLQDYPDWVFQGVLFAKLITHHAVPGYAFNRYPVPNSLTTVGIGFFSLAFGWKLAAKLWVVLVLLALGAGTLHLLRRLNGNSTVVLPLLACSVLTGLDLWNGSLNFQLGLALCFFFLAQILKPRASSWGTAVLLLLCFFTHMLPCGAALLALIALALQQRNLRRLLPAIPVALCGIWYALKRDPGLPQGSPLHLLPAIFAVASILLWAYRHALSELAAGHRKTSLSPWIPTGPFLVPALKLGLIIGAFGPLSVVTSGLPTAHVLWPVPVFAFFCVAGTLTSVGIIAILLRNCLHLQRSAHPYRFLAITALALAAMFVLLPPDALGVTGIDSRILHLSLGIGAALLGLRPSRWLTPLAAATALLCAVNLYQFNAVQRHADAVSLPYDKTIYIGASPVAPAIRLRYYRGLETNTFGEYIFGTAMFRQTPH